MDAKTITTPGGEKIVLLSEAEYEALLAAVEDAEDIAAAEKVKADIAAGRDEYLPMEVVEALLAGESPIRAFRKLRGLTQADLAARAGISQAAVTAIEGGKREGSITTYAALARALAVDIDDLAPKMNEDGARAMETPAAQITLPGKGVIVQATEGGKAAPARYVVRKVVGRKASGAKESVVRDGRRAAPAARVTRKKKA